MASKGCYILADDPGDSYTDKQFTYTIHKSGDMSGVTYSFGWEFTCEGVTTKETVVSGITSDTYTWTPTSAKFGPLMKKSLSGVLKIVVKTINGSPMTYSREFILTLNESIKPDVSNLTVDSPNKFNGKFIRNVSDLTVSAKIKNVYGSDITVRCIVNPDDDIFSSVLGTINHAGASNISLWNYTASIGATYRPSTKIAVKATDARGRSSTAYVTITIYEYSPPGISATVTWNVNEKPLLTFTPTYQETVAGATNSIKQFFARCVVGSNVNDTDLKDKTSPQVLTGTYDISKSYTFSIFIQDSVKPSTTLIKVTLPNIKPVMDIGSDGKTVTFFGTSPTTATEETLRIGDFASFGKTVRLGYTNGRNTQINSNGLVINNGTTPIAQIGYGSAKDTNGNTVNSPYYTLGTRKSGSSVGAYSYAEGENQTASGYRAHTEGGFNIASGSETHAEGFETQATNYRAHAEGYATVASGMDSHAEGYETVASGFASHAGGEDTIAASDSQTAIGKYNIADSDGKYALIVGNGAGDDKRSNALTVDWDGNVDANKFRSKQTILWSGAHYMQGDQTITLSQPISSQANGIMLIFSAYADGKAQNYEFSSHYISKAFVAKHPNTPQTFMMGSPSLLYFATKVLKFTNTTIIGNDLNKDGAKTSSCGIKLTNNRYVLRYVIGV